MSAVLVIGCAGFAVLIGAIAALLGGWIALVFAALLVWLLLLAKDYRVGVIALVLAVPFLGAHYQGANVFVLLMASTLASFGVHKWFRRQAVVALPREVWLGLVATVLIGALVGYMHIDEAQFNLRNTLVWETYSAKGYFRLSLLFPLGMIVVSWLLANATRDSRRPELFLVPMAAVGIVMVARIVGLIVESGLDLGQIQSRREFFSELGHHANEFGPLFAVASGPFLFLTADSRGRARLLSASVLAFMLCGMTLVFSRGGYVAFIVVLTTFLVMRARLRVVVGVVTVCVVALFLMPDAVFERVTTGMDSRSLAMAANRSETDELTAGRFAVYSMLAPEILKSPIWGGGTGSNAWSDAIRNGWITALHPHNMYLRVLMDVGVIGFVLWGYFWLKTVRRMKVLAESPALSPLMRSYFAGSFAGVLGMLASGLSGGDWAPSIGHPFLWYSAGLAFAFRNLPAIQAPQAMPVPKGHNAFYKVSRVPRVPSRLDDRPNG